MNSMNVNKRKEKILIALKAGLEMISFPPNYISDFEFYSNDSGFNCYAYAMQYRLSSNEKPSFLYKPGFLSNSASRNGRYPLDSIINGLINDCECLNLLCEESSLDSSLKENAYKIGVLISKPTYYRSSFHFIRQNDDLSWSEKRGHIGKVGRLETLDNDNYFVLKKIMMISRKK